MKNVGRVLLGIGLITGLCYLTAAQSANMTGMISDSACGASHAKMIASHTGTKWTDRDCTQACVKGGAKYVFVSGGKVYNLSNQSFAGLADHAGETVSLTGDLTGSDIAITKIDTGAKK